MMVMVLVAWRMLQREKVETGPSDHGAASWGQKNCMLDQQTGRLAWTAKCSATLAALGGALSMRTWGQMLDRYGNKAVMTFSLILWQLGNFVWCFLEPGNRNLLYPLWTWGGMTSAGFILGQFTLLLKLLNGALALKNTQTL